jgi:hypothetical protein
MHDRTTLLMFSVAISGLVGMVVTIYVWLLVSDLRHQIEIQKWRISQWMFRFSTAESERSARSAEAIQLTRELEDARLEVRMLRDLQASTLPCGHPSAYASIEDGKGRHIRCWRCRAERAEAAPSKETHEG